MENGIVTLARRKGLCKISSGAITELPKIASIAVGDGGVDASGEPVPPTETQTGLKHQLGVYPLDSVTYPAETTAQYVATIPKDDLVGAKISELALVDEAGNVCAIRTTYVKQKGAGEKMTLTLNDEF